jgi:hypothetical protein
MLPYALLGDELSRTFYRMVATDPPTNWDFLSQAARRQPPPRQDAEFLEAWRGLSVLDTYKVARQNGKKFRWRHGEYIAILSIPDDAPFTYKGPEHRGHWMIYDAAGTMLEEEGAKLLRQSYVVRVVHGPSTEEVAL